MKHILNFIKSGFTDIGYNYHSIIYWYEGKPEIGYVITYDYRVFWLPTYTRISLCLTIEEVQETLEKLKKIIPPKSLELS
jgi:hypothetical protein